MTRSLTLAAALLTTLAVAVLPACRGSGDDVVGDDTQPDGGTNPDDVSIYDIQGTLPVDGAAINVRGVVVTAIDNYGGRKGNFWVEEPAGGPYSGVLVYGADLGAVADLQVGDLVDLESVVKDEFALVDDTTGRTTTELVPPDGGAIVVTVVGTGTVPAPAVVDSLAIGQMLDQADRDAEWEKWEGVLLQVNNVSITSGLRSISSTDTTFVEFQVTGPVRVDSSLTALIDPVTVDDCLASVTGIGDYFFNYKILPRTTAEIATGGSGCPAQESDATACDNGIDDDADGFADCADFSCQVLPACQTDTTVSDVQMGTVSGAVTLSGVVITAISKDGKHLWVADDPAAAAYNGVYVYRGSGAAVLTGEFVIGATVDVHGTVSEYDPNNTGNPLTEILAYSDQGGAVTFVSAPGTAPTPITNQTAATLADFTNGEPYEGVLVQLANMKVTVVTTSGQRRTLSDGTNTIVMDDDAYDYQTAYPVDTCFATITGVMTTNTFDNERRILPRPGDIVDTGGTCN
ncbi:MAG: hypothetical protein H6709_21545 [Kofleriaceae bacterium]|nr:hypothetical protein [Myxococcales bacterium]MCB9564322.1 hypothetical protein [Kofleriaceae bacterium]MCB9574670.1 hypothetical protein [Kofleriaceae bacterium]